MALGLSFRVMAKSAKAVQLVCLINVGRADGDSFAYNYITSAGKVRSHYGAHVVQSVDYNANLARLTVVVDDIAAPVGGIVTLKPVLQQ